MKQATTHPLSSADRLVPGLKHVSTTSMRGMLRRMAGPILTCVLSLGASAQSGLLAYYPLNGNANDASGNANHGTVLGATLATDRFGNPDGAYQFGADHYIQLPVSGNQKPMSLAVWFKTGDNIDGPQAIVDNDAPGHGGHSIFMGFWPQNGQNHHLQIQTHDYYLDSGVIAQPNTWYHVVGVWADTAAIYVNGQKMAEISYPATTLDGDDYRIGRHNAASPYWFLGVVDDVRIYDRALTDAEIAVLAADETPVIVTHPQSQTVAVGGTATFSVTATGADPLTYQWQYNEANLTDGGRISGATTTTLTLSDVETSDAGNYRVVVSNPSGSVTSQVAVLSVFSGPPLDFGLIAHYPLNGDANDASGNGNNGTVLGATPTTDRLGNPDGAYQFGADQYIQLPVSGNQKPMSLAVWFKTGDSVDGPQAIVDNDVPDHGGHSVFMGFWPQDGQNRHLQLEIHEWSGHWYLDSGVIAQPNTWYHVAGIWSDKVTIYVNGQKTAEADYPMTLLDGTDYRIGRHNDPFPSWFLGVVDDVRIYYRALTDVEIAQLAADLPPQITTQPQSQSVPVGGTATFTVSATGPEPLSYQWQFNSVPLSDGGRISGATTSTLTIASVQDGDVGSYTVVVNNVAGTASSEAAQLTIREPQVPQVTLRVVDQNGQQIPASLISVAGVGTYSSGETVGIPEGSYGVSIFPGINGQLSADPNNVGSFTLKRDEVLEVTAQTGVVNYHWIVAECPVSVVDAGGGQVPGSTFSLLGVLYQNDALLQLPTTDNDTYPAIGGPFADGYSILVQPGDTSGSGTFQFEVLPGGAFEPEWFTIDARQYGLRFVCNQPPVVDAGDNLTILSEQQSSTTLTGHAIDPDQDPLAYRWLEGNTELLEPNPVEADGACPLHLATLSPLSLGSHTLTLEVTDGLVTVQDTTVLTVGNSPPVVACAGSINAPVWTPVDLNATVADFDGDTLTWAWTEGLEVIYQSTVTPPAGGASLPLPPVRLADGLPLGLHTFTVTVSDGQNPLVSCQVAVTVSDTDAPTLAPVANPAILWPPNHQMVDVFIETHAADNSGDPVTLVVDQITSTEDPDKDGDGHTIPDFQLIGIDQANGVIHVQLRSERSGQGDGRIYTITITGTDASGNATTVSVEVLAPHDKGKGK